MDKRTRDNLLADYFKEGETVTLLGDEIQKELQAYDALKREYAKLLKAYEASEILRDLQKERMPRLYTGIKSKEVLYGDFSQIG